MGKAEEQNRLEKLKYLCKKYKYQQENKELDFHRMIDVEAMNKQSIFEEAMKLMLGDGIIEYLNQL